MYVNQDFGMFIHWNMSTFVDMEWANPNLNVNTFAPTALDIDQWLNAAVAAGMTYACLTVKHHDGFCLWPTAHADAGYDPYSIAQTTWYAANGSPDVVGLFVTKCHEHDLNPVLYFSMWDRTHEARVGTGAAEYLAMVQTQLNELLTDYGPITALWFDGWRWQGLAEVALPYQTIYDYIKARQPNCLVIENTHTHPALTGQIEVYETSQDGSIPAGNTRLSEEANSIRVNGRWFYRSTDGQTASDYTAAATILAAKVNANNNSATYLLNVTPGTDGHLPAAQVTRLGELGA